MRSRKLSPGSAVMRMMSQSERTRVPPVTAERSPPDSRMTGALSPVIALSSTQGDALDHLAVTGKIVTRIGEHHVAAAELRREDRFNLVHRRLHRVSLGGAFLERGGAEFFGVNIAACLAEVVRLGLAAALGHRLG